ncbi:two-component system OmpR family response regulator [Spelaeicoccus albus]|uniref:Two-component system OmpR family response regulator n=1 Tax=Spelaeicoccus albus TaxID=1280376 RepID=A0A7Z0A7F2_9MICO|nr:response regulator transcription factor [Spelaeicoccus albus]NYI65804.1 two-component system OmpR family response regulator [Spelaeicoccus albus]
MNTGTAQEKAAETVRALIVDDEQNLAELLSLAFRYQKWESATAFDGAGALAAMRDFRPSIVILDVMLPDINGLELLAKIRGINQDVPVLFLTAKDAVEDRVVGLTAGGDDYVTKPFSLEEVVARVRALMRRAGSVEVGDDAVIQVGDLTLDEDSHEVYRAGEPVELTAKEFELLRFMMRNPRRVLSKPQILDRVWSYDFGGNANVVELYISYLRKKIDAGRSPMIKTLRGAGYMLKAADG